MGMIKDPRHEEISQIRRERYEWAKEVDPEAVEEFEATTFNRIHRSELEANWEEHTRLSNI